MGRTKIPKAPDPLPENLDNAAAALVNVWIQSSARPCIASEVALRWHSMILTWANDPTMPLFVRKTATKLGGYIIPHVNRPGGVVPCDNSPAQWVMRKCLDEYYDKTTPIDYNALLNLVQKCEFPVRLAMTRVQRLDEKCLFKKGLAAKNGISTELQYHTAHVVEVGLADKAEIPTIAIDALRLHFIRLMSPINMMLVPLSIIGLADLARFKQPAIEANRVAFGHLHVEDLKPNLLPVSPFIGEHTDSAPNT